MTIYIIIVIDSLSRLELWFPEQIKNTIFWYLSVGSFSLFKLERIKKDPKFLKSWLLNNFALATILEFIVGIHIFNFWLEILLVPFLIIISVFVAVSQTDPTLKLSEKFFNALLMIFGMLLMIYSAYKIISDFSAFVNLNTLFDFFLPIILSILIIPFILLMILFTSYENIFVHLPSLILLMIIVFKRTFSTPSTNFIYSSPVRAFGSRLRSTTF